MQIFCCQDNKYINKKNNNYNNNNNNRHKHTCSAGYYT